MEDTNRHQIRRPPFDVRRTTVLDLVKFHAGSNPRHIFCWQLEDLSRELTLIEITYETFYRMVGFCQSWLKKNLPERVQSHSVESPIALLLDSDVGAMVYLVASIGLGISVFLLSDKLSPYTLRHLLSHNKIATLITSSRCRDLAEQAMSIFDSELQIKTFLALDYRQVLDQSRERNTRLDDHNSGDTLTLHTNRSGSLPRAVPLPRGYLITLAGSATCLPIAIGMEQRLILSTFPLQHCCGLLGPMVSLRNGAAFISPPASWVPCAESTLRMLRQLNVHDLVTCPSILEIMAHRPGALPMLKRMHSVVYTWGILGREIGEQLTLSGVKLVNAFGTTETGIISTLSPADSPDWRFFRLRPDLQYNACADTSQQPAQCRISVQQLGQQHLTVLDDTFVRSPEHTASYRCIDLADRVIILDNGDPFPFLLIEDALNGHVNVHEAVVFVYCSTIVVLVEATTDMTTYQRSHLEASIRSMILQTWDLAWRHAHLISTAIFQCGTFFPRSADGSILRDVVYEHLGLLMQEEN